MHKTLNLDDLIAKKNSESIETDPELGYEELYDLIIPLEQLYQLSTISWKNSDLSP
ncbi:hypothetical protein [Methanosarcina horonobensis]|uniref:hypothetical protein n=1 Tax=Methanosarcina horonobensis TaxID=418008 RepID=UPI000AA25857